MTNPLYALFRANFPLILYLLGPVFSIDICNLFHVDKSSSSYVRAISFLIINHNESLLPNALICTYVQCTGSMYTLKVTRWRESACIGCIWGILWHDLTGFKAILAPRRHLSYRVELSTDLSPKLVLSLAAMLERGPCRKRGGRKGEPEVCSATEFPR